MNACKKNKSNPTASMKSLQHSAWDLGKEIMVPRTLTVFTSCSPKQKGHRAFASSQRVRTKGQSAGQWSKDEPGKNFSPLVSG